MVRKVLTEVSKAGLPGNHHFFISFASQAPGVNCRRVWSNAYPSEMTIVLQDQFWDLKVSDDGFEVGPSLRRRARIAERAIRPIIGFFDPSVNLA